MCLLQLISVDFYISFVSNSVAFITISQKIGKRKTNYNMPTNPPRRLRWTARGFGGQCTGKNNGFPFLDILGYLKNTHKNPKFGKVRQGPTKEFPTKFPDWDLSHSSKFGIFVGIL